MLDPWPSPRSGLTWGRRRDDISGKMRLGFCLSIMMTVGLSGFPGLTAAQPTEVSQSPTRQRIVAVGNPADDLQVFASHHYHIHTNLSREETVPFGRHMDAVFAQYERRFADYTERHAGLMPLYLFRHQDEYLDFMRHHGIDATGSGGMFFVTHSIRGLATWAHGHSRSQTLRTLQHEGFHQFAWNHLGPNLPTWMNEGLAQYFEDAVILDTAWNSAWATPTASRRARPARIVVRSIMTIPSRSLQMGNAAIAVRPTSNAVLMITKKACAPG